MFKKKSAYVLPVVVLLFLSLITSASTVGTLASAEGRGDTVQHATVYIHSLYSSKGVLSASTDEIEWYQGVEADKIFAQREPEAAAELGGTPDGYYIVNDSQTLTTYKIAPDATVTMQIYDRTGKLEDIDVHWNEKISLEEFTHQFAKNHNLDLSQFPYHLTIKDGVITSIVQQYIP
ncbi:hypothetical protein [Paenibacillus sp. NPDC057934]|uniref:hypothetical protein n=1 Tax=Paenibacillus sp. NPDC057934 TaxID=3346282 RepID=UPI0036DCDC1E